MRKRLTQDVSRWLGVADSDGAISRELGCGIKVLGEQADEHDRLYDILESVRIISVCTRFADRHRRTGKEMA